MSTITQLAERLQQVMPAEQVSLHPQVLRTNSQDYAWFSNVLEEELKGAVAEIVVWPTNVDQLRATLASAYTLQVPVTVRGGGTGNYGQCVPLRGGLVVAMERLTGILSIEPGQARVQAGVRFVDLDQAALPTGQEICIYPSTYLTATIAGFVAGGSGGVGSCTHGTLVDDNVLGATVMSLTGEPFMETVRGDEMRRYMHAYGTTGILVDVTVPLTARTVWEQAVISFPSIEACHAFCLELLTRPDLEKRLISSAEPEVVRYFTRSRLPFDTTRSAAMLMYREGRQRQIMDLAEPLGGRLDIVLAAEAKTRITDFTWNHTTLWAKKANRRALTYLQCGFAIERFPEQLAAIRKVYPASEFAVHGEYFHNNGAPFLASLPIVAYHGREALDRLVEFLESIEVFVANPHRYVLEQGSRVDNIEELLETKRRMDPAGLLNPGKLGAWDSHAAGLPLRTASLSLAARSRRRVAR
jgi:FAD/FMN-containing dehydrogenase